MPKIKFAKQPKKWKKSLVFMLQMKLQVFGPGFEQTGA